MNWLSRLALPGAVLLASAVVAQTPVGSALTYQGELRQSGNPVNGTADFRFRLYSADTGGSQLGPEIPITNGALAGGRFTVSLDFGGTAFGSDARWLEIDVRSPAGAGVFVTLSPRQRLTAAPVAQFGRRRPVRRLQRRRRPDHRRLRLLPDQVRERLPVASLCVSSINDGSPRTRR